MAGGSRAGEVIPPLRLVVSGYYGFGNVGDEALLAGMLEQFETAGVERSDVTVLSGAPAETERVHRVRSVSRTNVAGVIAAIGRADGLISGGGGLLQDATSARPVAYYAGVTQLARAAGRPYAILAQGLGPLNRNVNRHLVRLTLGRAAHVSLRDDESIALARVVGVRRAIDRTADPALALTLPATQRASGSHVIVAARGGDLGANLVAPLRAAVARLSVEHRVVALAMDATVDHAASAAVVENVPGALLADPDASLDDKLRLIADASVVVGARLHALVVAAAAGVAAVAVPYDPKVTAFAVRAGMPVAESAGSLSGAEAILDGVRRSLAQDRDAYHERVEALRDEARAGIAAAVHAIAGARRPSVSKGSRA